MPARKAGIAGPEACSTLFQNGHWTLKTNAFTMPFLLEVDRDMIDALPRESQVELDLFVICRSRTSDQEQVGVDHVNQIGAGSQQWPIAPR
jgi:hypothetical protein